MTDPEDRDMAVGQETAADTSLSQETATSFGPDRNTSVLSLDKQTDLSYSIPTCIPVLVHRLLNLSFVMEQSTLSSLQHIRKPHIPSPDHRRRGSSRTTHSGCECSAALPAHP